MIGIINYGAGNLLSVKKAFEYIGARVKIISKISEAKSVSKIVLPGVGAFESAMIKLKEIGLIQFIYEWIVENKPFLGICLGLQLLFDQSEESENTEGFKIFSGRVIKFKDIRCPQIGWNQVWLKKESILFNGINDGSFFYFLHSYYIKPENNGIIAGLTNYGIDYASVIEKGSIYAVQFHPEKSGKVGIKLLTNWLNM